MTAPGDTMGAWMEAVSRAIEEQGHLMAALENAVISLARGEKVDGIPEPRTETGLWTCEQCGNRLGTYDAAADVMRIKYKDLYVQIHPGAGGWISTPCRYCGHVTRATDTRPEPPIDYKG